MHLARAGLGAPHGSQTAAVDEYHLAEMKNDRPTVAQQMSHVGAQGYDLASGNDASFAAHDGDASYLAGFPVAASMDFQSGSVSERSISAPPYRAHRP